MSLKVSSEKCRQAHEDKDKDDDEGRRRFNHIYSHSPEGPNWTGVHASSPKLAHDQNKSHIKCRISQ